ncbi:hypothetical protein [Leifsonia sp. NPDC058230]|uniref:hypothetical protein n=1 Tax=Leifsonia sp. NPDC058230 TaxID=3346391 RepID=UPI0036DD0DBE
MALPSDPRAFRFEPRKMISAPGQFGKSSLEPRPVDGASHDDPRFKASRLQHLIANAAREAMLEQGHTLKSFTDEFTAPGMTYDRLVRIHRGESLMQLADLVNLASLFPQVRALLQSEIVWA